MKEKAQVIVDDGDSTTPQPIVERLFNDPDALPETLVDAWRCFVLAPALRSQRQN